MDIKLNEIKRWNPEIERKITESWKKSERYRIKGGKPIYSIDTPPPYINAPIHIGHAVTYAYQDFFARYKRMRGFEVLFPLGLDRNGLPIELGAEKKYKVTPQKVGREKFLEYCERLLNEIGEESVESFVRLGISFTSYQRGDHRGSVYHTDSPEYRSLTQATFIDLYKKGIIYEDVRINNWDPKLQTTIADSEIDYEEKPSTLNYVKWKVKETGEQIIIATTRPELIATCAMVIYHPDDEKYKHLEGKHAITPIYSKEVPIKAHPFANPEKGSGLVMMCSAGDLTDIQFFREQNLKPTIAINKDGTMNEHAGLLKGLPVKKAREKVIELLKEKGLIEKQEQITHRTPISERSKAEIEFIEMPEFYLKQLEYKETIKKISEELTFYPAEAKKILDAWINTISIDWPISRRRYYATPIPLWSSDELVAVPPPGKYYVPWKEDPPKDADVMKDGKPAGKVSDYNVKWVGETRVLDTWFDSSISPLFITRYTRDEELFKQAYPVSLRPQGKEIVRTWLYYSLLRGYLATGKPCFKDVWIHQHITDESGRKMSKSLGNVINPQDIIKNYGAEAMRLWAAIEGNLAKQDLRCSKEKINAELKTINKLINVAKFVLRFEKPKEKPKLCPLDELFINHLEELTLLAKESYDSYEFHIPMIKLRHFLWEVMASHYIELVKSRAYNREGEFEEEESAAARHTLHALLERFIRLCYPIIPQVTSIIANEMNIDIHSQKFPEPQKGKENKQTLDKLIEFNKKVWKAKKEKGIALNMPIENIEIPDELKAFEPDLKACHRI